MLNKCAMAEIFWAVVGAAGVAGLAAIAGVRGPDVLLFARAGAGLGAEMAQLGVGCAPR